jgi:hypothetical protein
MRHPETHWSLPLAAALALACGGAALPALDIERSDIDARIQGVTVLASLARSAEDPQPHVDELLAIARTAIEAPAPCPYRVTSHGRVHPDEVSHEFAAWAVENRLDPEDELRWIREGLPALLAAMVTLGTPSSIEILERAVASGDCVLTPAAAPNLAFVGDPRHVAVIEGAAAGQPTDIRTALAIALLLYRTPDAEAAATRLIGREGLEALLEAD